MILSQGHYLDRSSDLSGAFDPRLGRSGELGSGN